MPYAAPISSVCTFAERRAAVRRYEQARHGELDRIVARIHADMDKRAANDDWAALIDYAKQGEIGPVASHGERMTRPMGSAACKIVAGLKGAIAWGSGDNGAGVLRQPQRQAVREFIDAPRAGERVYLDAGAPRGDNPHDHAPRDRKATG